MAVLAPFRFIAARWRDDSAAAHVEFVRETLVQKRQLGRSNLMVSPLSLGGNVFGWTADRTATFNVLDAYVAMGFNAIDTADVYSIFVAGHHGGESETLIGEWLEKRGARDKVVIATKVGFSMGEGKSGLRKNYIVRAVNDSLARLKTDYIDLYYAHCDDRETPLEETLGAFASLIESGKVRTIAASNYGADRLRQSLQVSRELGLPRYECLQPHFNLYESESFLKNLAPVCREQELGVLSYFSLASGFLTGKYRKAQDVAGKARAGMLKDMFNPRGMRILQALDAVAEETSSTPAQISLAWLLARGVSSAIVSATSVAQLEELAPAATLKLHADALRMLDEAAL